MSDAADSSTATARYSLEQQLDGGQGGIRLGRDRASGRRVVLRRDPEARTSFARRRRLEHPGLAGVLGVAELEGELSLVEEFIAGPRWDESPPAGEEEWWLASRDLLAALTALHEHGLVHRDLKPENAILSPRARGGVGPVLIDFGLAVPVGARVGPGGTLGTAAPEIFDGGRADARADLFGAGALLLAAALGVAPDPAWSLDAGALERALARAPRERRGLLEALCAPLPERRANSASAALELVPRNARETALPAASRWPLVGRAELLDRVLDAARERGDRALLVALDGPRGIGKHRLARAVARELAFALDARALDVTELGELPRGGTPELATWLTARASAPPCFAVGVLAHATDLTAYADALPSGELLHLALEPLPERDVESLLHQLGLGALREARALREQTGGVPRAIAEQLLPTCDPTQLRGPARRVVLCAHLLDLPLVPPLPDSLNAGLEEALREGALEMTRAGEIVAAQPWATWDLLRPLGFDPRFELLREAASAPIAAPRSIADASWHALLLALEANGRRDAQHAREEAAQHALEGAPPCADLERPADPEELRWHIEHDALCDRDEARAGEPEDEVLDDHLEDEDLDDDEDDEEFFEELEAELEADLDDLDELESTGEREDRIQPCDPEGLFPDHLSAFRELEKVRRFANDLKGDPRSSERDAEQRPLRDATLSELACAASDFARACSDPVVLERRIQILGLGIPGPVLARCLQALAPALRRLLGGGRLPAVAYLIRRVRMYAAFAPCFALNGRLRFEYGSLEVARNMLRLAAPALPRDLDVQHDLLRTLLALGRWDEVLELARLLEERGQAATPEQRAVLAQARALVHLRQGRGELAAAQLRASLAEFPAEPPRALRLLSLQNLALAERHRGELRAAERALAEAAEGFARLGDPRNTSLVEANLAVLLQDLGDPALGRATAERVARRAAALGLDALARIARATAAIASARLGASPAVADELGRIERELREHGQAREAAIAAARRAQVELELEERVVFAEGDLRARLEPEACREALMAAAIAATALLEHGAPIELPWQLLRVLLRGVDRANADHLRCAWDLAERGALSADRRAARLERLARHTVPELAPRAFAAAARLGGPRAITRAAQALRAARAIRTPRRAIEAWLAAAHVALEAPRARPLRHVSRVLERCFAALREEGGRGTMEGNTEMRRYDEALAELAERAARLPRGGARTEAMLRTLASLNALLLDERVPEEEKCTRILDAAVRTTGAARGALLVREDDGSERLVASSGLGAGESSDEHRQLSRSVLARVLETGAPVRTVDAMADPQFRHALSVAHFQLSSIACVPLRAGARTIGALYLDHPHERGAFAEEVLELLGTLADQASLSLAATRQRERIAALNAQLEAKLAQSTRELADARAAIASARGATTVVHQSAIMRALLERVQRIAVSELPALVRGETGTGKELIARRLHELSARRDGPFVSENCSALPGELLESELFGHEKGAFTGALRDKPGLLRMAHGGTLFLDEIGDMPFELQTRLLRVLQEGRVRPVGADREVAVDVRLVTATHRDLEALVREGRFREDLYYRIRVAELLVPPLRERREDIPLLVDALLADADARATLAPAALEALLRYAWPGNVRELLGVLRSAAVLKRGERIELDDLPSELRGDVRLGSGGLPSLRLVDLERLALEEALKQVGGHRARAAELLGISRSSVFNKLREHGLS